MSENIIINGREYVVTIAPDEDHGAPWDECDGCGIVSKWTTRGKYAGEFVLNTDGSSRRYYNYAATLQLARRDEWGLSPDVLAAQVEQLGRELTSREITAAAVMRDYEHLRAWCNDEWNYVGVIVTAPDGEKESLWGIESNSDDYIQEVAHELAKQLNSSYQDRQTEEATQC